MKVTDRLPVDRFHGLPSKRAVVSDRAQVTISTYESRRESRCIERVNIGR